MLEFYETRARCLLSLVLLYQPLYPGKGILKGLRIGRLYEDDFQSREVHVYKYKLLYAIDIYCSVYTLITAQTIHFII